MLDVYNNSSNQVPNSTKNDLDGFEEPITVVDGVADNPILKTLIESII